MLEKNQKNEADEAKRKYWQIMDEMQNIFRDTSDNYRQKLVYNLLNAVKGNNQKEFFWTVLRALNARLDKPEVTRLSEEIGRMYPLISSEFEKLAYSVIMGIMSAKSERGDKNE